MLVDDSRDDIFLTTRAMTKAGLAFSLIVSHDAEEAIQYLSQPDKTLFPLPRWIVTDMKMPRMSGIELLYWIKHSPYHHIPVVIFSSSAQDHDLADAFGTGANSYLIKPNSFDDMVELWKAVGGFWARSETVPNFPFNPSSHKN
ncbi:MAG: response regulator [Verrucomicrobiota bacterium]